VDTERKQHKRKLKVFEMSCSLKKDFRGHATRQKAECGHNEDIERLQIRRLTYFGHVSRSQLKDFHILHCLDVLRDLVQEEDLERNGWTMSKKIVRL